MKELIIDALDENLETVQEFVRTDLEQAGCSMPVTIQLEIAIEEIFVNICHYAYEGREGVEKKAAIRCDINPETREMFLEFSDRGIPFNPLAKEDADITLSAEERGIGGLGILMVKKTMDSMNYEYKNEMNILSMKKAF